MKEYYISTAKDIDKLKAEICKVLIKGFIVKVTCKKANDDKTNQQLAYYWGVILPTILKQLYADGYTKADYTIYRLHTELKTMFFYDENILEKKEISIRVPKSLAEASKDSVKEYIDNIIIWASSNGIIIPEPKEELKK